MKYLQYATIAAVAALGLKLGEPAQAAMQDSDAEEAGTLHPAAAETVPANDGDNQLIEVNGNYGPTMATVKPLGPDRAQIDITPLRRLNLGAPPSDIRNFESTSDISGKGPAYMSRFGHRAAAKGYQICALGVNWSLRACGNISGTSASIIIDAPGQRNKILLFTLTLVDQSGTQLAWVLHPENTRDQLKRCNGRSDTISAILNGPDGQMRIPTRTERLPHLQAYSGRC